MFDRPNFLIFWQLSTNLQFYFLLSAVSQFWVIWKLHRIDIITFHCTDRTSLITGNGWAHVKFWEFNLPEKSTIEKTKNNRQRGIILVRPEFCNLRGVSSERAHFKFVYVASVLRIRLYAVTPQSSTVRDIVYTLKRRGRYLRREK